MRSDFRPLADGPDVGLDGFQIFEGVRPLGHVPQQGGGMVNGGHVDAAPLEPLAVLSGDAEVLPDDLLGGDAAQTDDDLGPQQRRLTAQPAQAGLLLHVQGVPVLGRTAFDDVTDIAVVSAQVNDGEHLVKKLNCRADKRLNGQILLLAGTLADKYDVRRRLTDAENHIGPGPCQGAGGALQTALP